MPLEIQDVLILHHWSQPAIEILSKFNIQVQTRPELVGRDGRECLLKVLPNFDVAFIANNVIADAEFFESAAPRLKCLIFPGAGIDHIDVQKATEKGVIVMNSPDSVTIPTAEFCCMLILALAKNVTRVSRNLQGNGVFDRRAFMGTDIQSKTLGILGFGRIGKQVAVRMAAFGMKIIAYSRSLIKEDADKFGVEAVSLDELYCRSDFISINTPLTDQTKKMINLEVFKKCKPGVRIVNTARGAIINQSEAIVALNQNLCAGIAADVFDEEPPKSADTWKFIQHEKVIATPHISAISAESIKQAVVDVAEQLVRLIRGQPISNCVNPSTLNLL